MTFDDPYLKQSVVTYLGNKRKLLPFIHGVIDGIIEQQGLLTHRDICDISVMDIFSGSGIVSRSLKLKGFHTFSNDLEDYTVAINRTFIATNESDLPTIFSEIPSKLRAFYTSLGIEVSSTTNADSYQESVDLLNEVRSLPGLTAYFSKHYSPEITDKPKAIEERMFFTQENGMFIDSVLDVIFDVNIFSEHARHIILADLLGKMSKNSNTSGMMKAFHHQWGGGNSDALGRIKKDIKLERLTLLDTIKGEVFNTHAEKLFAQNPTTKVDIIYADPPYNQHQYASNYHLLTTAYRNRDYIVPPASKSDISGIRKDWTRSDFCYKRKIVTTFTDFVSSVSNHTDFLLISYSHQGYLKGIEIFNILSNGGKNTVKIEDSLHARYAGGKATDEEKSVKEYIFVVQMGEPQSPQDIKVIELYLNNESLVLAYERDIKTNGYQYFQPADSLKVVEENLAYFKQELPGVLLKAKTLKQMKSKKVTSYQITKVAQRFGIWERT